MRIQCVRLRLAMCTDGTLICKYGRTTFEAGGPPAYAITADSVDTTSCVCRLSFCGCEEGSLARGQGITLGKDITLGLFGGVLGFLLAVLFTLRQRRREVRLTR